MFCIKHLDFRKIANFIFYPYVYPLDLQESGANTQGKQLPRPASGNSSYLRISFQTTKN